MRHKDELKLEYILDVLDRCPHDDAKWLLGLLRERSQWSAEELKEVLRKSEGNRALLLLSHLSRGEGMLQLAQGGYTYAYGPVAMDCMRERDYDEALVWAKKGAALDDAQCTYVLAGSYRYGFGVEMDLKRAQGLLLRALELGSMVCLEYLRGFEIDSMLQIEIFYQRHLREAVVLLFEHDIHILLGILDDLWNAEDNKKGVFMAGELLKGRVNVEKCIVFGRKLPNWEDKVASCQRAVDYFESQSFLAREECVAWVLCARRLLISKDMRVKIAKEIWKTRMFFSIPFES